MRIHRQFAILDVPSNLGLKPSAPGREPGVRFMPAALREQGLVPRLRAEDFGEVAPLPYQDSVDPQTGIRNIHGIREYALRVADAVGRLLDGGFFPILLGGDCSILLGSGLALRRRASFGLLFIDGHTDLLTPERSKTAGAAGMDLALVTGTGPSLLTSIEGRAPYIHPADVVLFGYRWPDQDEQTEIAVPAAQMTTWPLKAIRDTGASVAAARALERFEHQTFWLHVDVDVLDPAWMPGVDSPDPGGLNPDELLTIVRAASGLPTCIGMEITIYDPTLDPEKQGAHLIVDLLAKALAE